MPFKETCRVEERIALFREWDSGAFTVSALCARWGISRETFYIWKARRVSGDERWFEARSHAPHACPQRTEAPVAAALVAVRERFPHFGPKKVRARLLRDRPDLVVPAVSTVGEILKRAGLVEPRRRRRRPIAQAETAPPRLAPNDEWSVDFKGWFRTRDGQRCDPLTLADTASRYLLGLEVVPPTTAGVQEALERAFAEHGLPKGLRSDNGPPFGSAGAGGLGKLSVWLLKLGVEPHHIRPASPQENGRHERFHRTLKQETAKPPAASIAEQQARFDRFRAHYNEERPHEALGQEPPAGHWQKSPRRLPEETPEPWYDVDHEVRRVRTTGEIKWRGGLVFIGEAFVGEPVGLVELDTGGHLVRFANRDLGVVADGGRFLRFAPPRPRRHSTPEPPPISEFQSPC